jgi:hypothetical protein
MDKKVAAMAAFLFARILTYENTPWDIYKK